MSAGTGTAGGAVDFHTHPFLRPEDNICRYADHLTMSTAHIPDDLRAVGIERCCGSVIRTRKTVAEAEGVRPDELSEWDVIARCNDDMMAIQTLLDGFYLPGMMVHPDYVTQSLDAMERCHRLGVRLIGELVPYSHGWEDYSCAGFGRILDAAAALGMVVSLHSAGDDAMDEMVRAHPHTKIVFAHPGEQAAFARHLARMEGRPNLYLDLSGTGLFRHGMLRTALDVLGRERVLFGSDYPVCSPAMFVGGVRDDPTLSAAEKQAVLRGNAVALFASVGLALD